MKFHLFALFALCVLSFNQISAQSFKERSELSVGPEFAFPIGNFHDISTFGIGGSAKYAYHFDPKFAVSLQSGWIHFNGNKDGRSYYYTGFFALEPGQGFAAIPLKIGGRYTYSRYFIEPQIGFTFFSYTNLYESRSTTFALNAGIYINKFLTADVRWERWNREGFGTNFLGARVAYRFRFSKEKKSGY